MGMHNETRSSRHLELALRQTALPRLGIRVLFAAFLAVATAAGLAPAARAQVGIANSGPFDQREIQTVTVRITNPSPDSAFNQRIEDAVRRGVRLFPGQRYSDEAISLSLAQVTRRNPQIANATYEPFPSVMGGVDVTVTVTLGDGVQPPGGRGMAATGNAKDFPLILDRNGTVLKFKLDLFALYYGNNNAWYGQPDPMLAGNPLVQGTPAGEGWSDWVEGYVQYGIYGITPLTDNLYAYGAFSAITSASTGDELFTDKTRDYTYWEDAYVGLVGGNVDSAGNRLTFNVSAGRQRFTLANAFLIANTAFNGWDRAALQANARWASDLLVLGEVAWNQTKFQAFWVDPDELPILDTGTKIAGVNVESFLSDGLMVGASWLTVPESTQTYFSPTGTVAGTREGLQLVDARFNWTVNPQGAPGPFFGAEGAGSRPATASPPHPGRPPSATACPTSPATIPTPPHTNAGTRSCRAVRASNGYRAPTTSRSCRIRTSSPTGCRPASGRRPRSKSSPSSGPSTPTARTTSAATPR